MLLITMLQPKNAFKYNHFQTNSMEILLIQSSSVAFKPIILISIVMILRKCLVKLNIYYLMT